MKRAGLALALAALVAPAVASAHPHIWISQTVRVVETGGAYSHVEIEWKFDPYASEDEIPAIDEDKDGKVSEEETRLLARDMLPELAKVGFLSWLNTGGEDFRPSPPTAFAARIDNPATFTPPDWDRSAGDGAKMPDNKRDTISLPPKHERARNLVYTFRFALPQPVTSFSITIYEPTDDMRIEVDKASLPSGCTLDKHPSHKAEFIPGQPVYADRVTCRLP
jgi:ABC-type uncharacterized transport system substrate-binding protein